MSLNESHHAELIAGIPALLGHHPRDRVVVLALYSPAVRVLSSDLGALTTTPDMADEIITHLGNDPADHVFIVVVTDRHDDDTLPEVALVERIDTAIRNRLGTHPVALWTPKVTTGASWARYPDPRPCGVLPAPDSTVVAAQMVARGMSVLPDLDAVRALVAPDPDEAVDRRAAILDRISTDNDRGRWHSTTPGCAALPVDEARIALVHHHVAATPARQRPLTDEEVAELAFALADHSVRDACMAYALGVQAADAERLWCELLRACPMPEAAEAAVLLAVFAYLRGEGVLAYEALERVRFCHRLVELLRVYIRDGHSPARLWGAIDMLTTTEEHQPTGT
ncbi:MULTISPECIES: DUF4192 domain-containing protein [Actinosynnema]|uniref:DUF4192 domain-containing protein n=1 Tax=Actinosynnema TaxID=40566 RepID=UPI0020A5B05B|nr:DUF4192 domain-containing protein [Actinosynnema pretiosum]MCP2094697.1 protein of unknown function (DUF4192) [Actinosynnema pretiosum]